MGYENEGEEERKKGEEKGARRIFWYKKIESFLIAWVGEEVRRWELA